jgi:hypothetical protein
MASYSPQEEALRTYNPAQAPANPRAPKPPTSALTGLPSGKTSQKPGYGPAVTGLATGVGAQIASGQVANALTGGAGAPSWASGAAGMGLGMGVNMAGNALANKLKPKEEMPTYGGRHGAITDQFGRRFEGAGPGVAGGAVRGATMGSNPALLAATGGISAGVGAIGGAIAGMATKNAPTAFSDFSANDAYKAIGDAYQQYLGRPASHEEIMSRLIGQGYRPDQNHKYVGQNNLYSQLDFIADSDEAKAYQARGQGNQAQNPESPSQSLTASQPNSLANTQPQLGTSPTASRDGQSYTSAQNVWNPRAPQLQPDGTYSAPPEGSLLSESASTNTESPSPPAPPPTQSTPPAPTASTGPPTLGQYALEGYDQTKLQSGHDSPKYLIGRTLSQFDPAQGLTPEAIAALNALGIGTFSGSGDKLSVTGGDPRFNGLSQFDVARDYTGEGGRTGSSAWQFAPDGPSAPGAQIGSQGAGYSQAFQAPQLGPQGNYSDSVIRYLLSQMGLDRAATQIGG